MAIGINDRVVGTCGRCGGPVVEPKTYMSTVKPVPACANCGATAKQSYGPVVTMNDPQFHTANTPRQFNT